MTLEINAQFKQFVQFAQQQADSEAIARTAPAPAEEGPLAGRAVMVGHDDKFGAFKRSAKSKNWNNETRALFRQSVNAIFGGAENLPKSVTEAMQLGDYDNQGKPLTVRHILAVQKAILQYKATVEVDHAFEHLTNLLLSSWFRDHSFRPLKLSSAQRQAAARTIVKYAKDLSGKSLRILADYVTVAAAREIAPEPVAQEIQKVFAKVRDIRPGDERLAEIEQLLLAHAREQLAHERAKEKSQAAASDDVSGAFAKVGPDSPVTINGTTFTDGPAAAAEFQAKVQPGHRKALAGFFSCMDNSPVVAMSTRSAPYDEVMRQPGAEAFASFGPAAESGFATWPVEVAAPKCSIEMAPDGKSATLSVETPGHLKFGFGSADADASLPIGGIAWKQEFVFDLSGPEAVLADARIGQELDV